MLIYYTCDYEQVRAQEMKQELKQAAKVVQRIGPTSAEFASAAEQLCKIGPKAADLQRLNDLLDAFNRPAETTR